MKKVLKCLCCYLLTVIILAGVLRPAVISAATTTSEFANNSQVKEFQQTISQLEAEQKMLKTKLKNVQNARYTAQQQANDLANLILNTEKKIEVTKSLLSSLDDEMKEKERQIEEKEREIEEKAQASVATREQFLALVRAQYENKSINVLSIMLGSDSISDLLSNMEYMGKILEYTAQITQKYNAEKQELQAMKEALEGVCTELQADYDAQIAYSCTLQAEQAELELQKGEKDKYISSLRRSEAEIQQEYETLQKAEEEENSRLEKLLKELAETNKTQYVGGKFIWPVDRSIKRISSDYGWRTYYYKGKQVTDFHRGIDIPSSTGTDIYAVQSGKVIVATSHSSYGNYCIVDHGGGITTLYAHCSKLLVKVGDTVNQGTHIAEMGSTGQSTGPHLHFEVRVNGIREDPIANGWVVQPK